MNPTTPSLRPFDLLRPFVWLAAAAFGVGFAIRLAAGMGEAHRPIGATPVSAPDAPAWDGAYRKSI